MSHAALRKSAKDKINERDKENQTPLHKAASGGHTDVCTILINNGAFVDAQDGFNYTPLHLAASKGKTNTCKALIAKGADVNATNLLGSTSLHMACESLSLNDLSLLCQALIEKGANVNAQDNQGDTPLHKAVIREKPLICRVLLKNGALISTTDIEGFSPSDYALVKEGINERMMRYNSLNVPAILARLMAARCVFNRFHVVRDIVRLIFSSSDELKEDISIVKECVATDAWWPLTNRMICAATIDTKKKSELAEQKGLIRPKPNASTYEALYPNPQQKFFWSKKLTAVCGLVALGLTAAILLIAHAKSSRKTGSHNAPRKQGLVAA